MAEICRKKVAELQTALSDPASQSEALAILCGLIERVGVPMDEDGISIDPATETAAVVSAQAFSFGCGDPQPPLPN